MNYLVLVFCSIIFTIIHPKLSASIEEMTKDQVLQRITDCDLILFQDTELEINLKKYNKLKCKHYHNLADSMNLSFEKRLEAGLIALEIKETNELKRTLRHCQHNRHSISRQDCRRARHEAYRIGIPTTRK